MELPDMLSIGEFDAIIFTLYSAAVISTLVRWYARHFVLRSVGLDDFLIIAAICLGALLCVFHHFKNLNNWYLYLMAEEAGQAVKTTDEAYDIRNASSRWSLLAEIAYTLELALIKLAILIFYRRFAPKRHHRWALYAIGILVISWTFAWIFTRMLGTEPSEALWTPASPNYTAKVKCTCEVLGIVQSSVQATVDLFLLVVPLPLLLKLKISARKKMGLLFIYAVGFISFGATMTRLVQSIVIYGGGGSKDFLEQRASYVLYSVWNSLEVNTALICANLPAFVPLFRSKRIITARSGSAVRYGNGSNHGFGSGYTTFQAHSFYDKAPDTASDDQTEQITLTTNINIEYDRPVEKGLAV